MRRSGLEAKRASLVMTALVIISTFYLALTIIPDNVEATTRYVGGTGPGNYTNIQHAITEADPGDTIFVYGGTYNEDVSVYKPLTLIGENKDTTIIHGSGTSDVVLVTVDGVTVTGFTAENGGHAFDEAGIRLFFVRNCHVFDNRVRNNDFGITLRQSSFNNIHNNTASDNGNGIYLWGDSTTHNTIINNNASGNNVGIYLDTVNNITITNNTIIDNRFGILVSHSSYSVVTDNVMVEDGIFLRGDSLEEWNTHVIDSSNTVNGQPVYYWKNTTGGTVPFDAGQVILANCNNVIIENLNVNNATVGIEAGFSSRITITNNIVSFNKYFGVYLYESDNSTVHGNDVFGNIGDGIYAGYSETSTFTENAVYQNSKAGMNLHGSEGNTISMNDLYSNAESGILLKYTTTSIVSDNTVFDNPTGLGAEYSNLSFISRNNISGNDIGIGLYHSHGNTFNDNTVLNNEWCGIRLSFSMHNILIGNTVVGGLFGPFYLSESDDNTLIGNYAQSDDYHSMTLWFSISNKLADNVMMNRGLFIQGDYIEQWNSHVIDTSNTVNGRPIHYWKNATGGTIPQGAGEVILGNCTYVVVENQDVSGGSFGIELGFSSNNTIHNNTVSDSVLGIYINHSENNTVSNNTASDDRSGIMLSYSKSNDILNNVVSSNNQYGIHLWHSHDNNIIDNDALFNGNGISTSNSDDNTISHNNVLNNGNGIFVMSSNNNLVYHNNIIDNTQQARDSRDTNQWDNDYPMGGNYWSDYTGIDQKSGPNQDMPGPDGIGDTPYVIDADSEDRYPLMIPPIVPPARPPTILQADLTGLNAEDITLTWRLSPDDGAGFQSVVSYEIYRGTTYHPDGAGYGLVASLPNGTPEFTNSLAGEGDSNNYFYQVCAFDLGTHIACSENQAAKFTRPLQSGTNLVSYPVVQSNDSIETVLQTVKWDKAWTFNSSTQKWNWHMRLKPYLGELERISLTQGLWVNVTEESNFTVVGIVPVSTSIHLHRGWNLVGFPSFLGDYTVADLKAALPVERVEGFDANAPPYFLRLMFDADTFETGYGYWVKVESDADWSVGNI